MSYATMENLPNSQTIALTSNTHFLKPNSYIYLEGYTAAPSSKIIDNKVNTQNCHCPNVCSCSSKSCDSCGK